MIKQSNLPKIIEHNQQHIAAKNGEKYEIKWKSKVLKFYSCGANTYTVECLEMIPGSLTIKHLDEGNMGEFISLKEFNNDHVNEQLDFRCNCHGFTFANGKYFITNYFVNDILEDEFEEVTDLQNINSGDYDVICFLDSGEWIHSCKYQYELYIQKEGIRKFSVYTDISMINKIDEYVEAKIHYFERKQKNCTGICLNAIGEVHVKTFANSLN